MKGNTAPIDVILIEDNVHDADLAIRVFTKMNLHQGLLHLEDGEEALDFIFAQNAFESRKNAKLPKLILLDLKLPKIDGIAVLKEIKNNERTKEIPVVVFTSSNQQRDVKICYELGVNAYVVKPLDHEDYKNVVSQIITFWMNINHSPSGNL
jgi:two-component system, response regulator